MTEDAKQKPLYILDAKIPQVQGGSYFNGANSKYELQVYTSEGISTRWKTYSNFETLYNDVKKINPKIDEAVAFPQKHYYSITSEALLNERKDKLEAFIKYVIENYALSEPVQTFFRQENE